ncbi:MAG: elongation factor Ts [Candidatus Omnitrophica bacterium]|nr:elongation factor Ts [Candidatus Omnitrophota bacterium]
MAAGSLDLVKELRERTGAGMMDCKAALQASADDLEKAVDFLRKKGLAQMAKRAGREAKEGLVAARVDGRKAALVEINCETDFVARTDDFQRLTQFMLDQIWSEGESALASAAVADKVAELTAKIGEKIAAKRAALLESPDGFLFTYVHSNSKLGVIVEVRAPGAGSKKDPVMEEVGKHLAMQVAASNPLCVVRSEVPAAVLEREKAVFKEESKGKPENIIEKIVQGKLEKFYQTVCLLEQPFIRDDKISVKQMVEEAGKKLGRSIEVKRFVRFQLGETLNS